MFWRFKGGRGRWGKRRWVGSKGVREKEEEEEEEKRREEAGMKREESERVVRR